MTEMSEQKITITCEPQSHICHVGDFAEFTIKSTFPDVEAEVVFTADGEAELGRFRLKTPCTLKQTLPFPGVLRCRVSSPEMETALAGVAFDPGDIRPALPTPADFQEFWQKALAHQKTIPPDFQMQEIPELSDSANTFYELSCNTVNNGKCYGFLRLPKVNAPVPLLVYFDGAGPGLSRQSILIHCANADAHLQGSVAHLAIFTHNYRPGNTQKEHLQLHQAYLKSLGTTAYWEEGLSRGREYTFFYRAILGAVRMCGLVTALPEVDKERVSYLGSSQGGGFGLFITALAPEINAAFCGVPACCDCGGFLIGRSTPTSNARYFRDNYQILRYFDPANFAPMIKVPVFMSCGFIDTTCPPSGIHAAYNSLGGPKMIFNKIHHGHGDGPKEYIPLSWFWIGCHLGIFK